MDVGIIDTTIRDGQQSLWASGMRSGMMEAVAEDLDRAGFDSIELPFTGNHLKKFVRDKKEDPFATARMLARKMPNTPKSCMCNGEIMPFEGPSPRELVELFVRVWVEAAALKRVKSISNTTDQVKLNFPWLVPLFRKLGVEVVFSLAYTISPRHTDAYYAEKTRELLAFKPDAIYIKDQCGILTVDRARTLIPAVQEAAAGIPLELHSHCTTGLAELVYLEALKLGIPTLHCAVPPLANGASQPSVLNVVRNARLMGHSTRVDEKLLRGVADRLTAFARADGLPIGAPLEYDYAQYLHQVPGGVISNLKFQLAERKLGHRLDEVLEESVRVRQDMGYPIMITPHSQFVLTQAAINVATGERYKLVTDEVIRFAQGVYGEDSGYPWMDQNLRDRLLALPRAKELAAPNAVDLSLKEIRQQFGGPGLSDEELCLRYIMKGHREIDAMRAAGPPRRYGSGGLPLVSLIEELEKRQSVRYVQVRQGGDSLVVAT